MRERHSKMAGRRTSDKAKSQRVFGQARKPAKMFRVGCRSAEPPCAGSYNPHRRGLGMPAKRVENPQEIYQIKVTLLGTSPPIWIIRSGARRFGRSAADAEHFRRF